MKILFVDACVRKESRTRRLDIIGADAEGILRKAMEEGEWA